MRPGRLRTKSVQILTAVFLPKAGPAGVGVAVANGPAATISSIYEQAFGSAEYLHFRAILHALRLGKSLRAERISVLCSDEEIVKLINREAPLEPGSPLFPIYTKIRGLMHTYRLAEVRAVPKSRVEPARRLAITASRMPVRKKLQMDLFPTAA